MDVKEYIGAHRKQSLMIEVIYLFFCNRGTLVSYNEACGGAFMKRMDSRSSRLREWGSSSENCC